MDTESLGCKVKILEQWSQMLLRAVLCIISLMQKCGSHSNIYNKHIERPKFIVNDNHCYGNLTLFDADK